MAPGADPRQIRVRFEGAELIEVDEQGDVRLRMKNGEVRQTQAVVYQQEASGKQTVAARYAARGDGKVGFELGSDDRSQPLVIDPVIDYLTDLGGSDPDAGERDRGGLHGGSLRDGRNQGPTQFPRRARPTAAAETRSWRR